jgi:hypothetical protein
MSAPVSNETRRLYIRPLPKGGYVAIEAQPVRTLFGPTKIRGQVIVERRSAERAEGHRALVAACAEQARWRDVIFALFPIAHSDQAIAELITRRVMVSVGWREQKLPA